MLRHIGLTIALLLSASPLAVAGKYNTNLEVGKPGAAWTGLPGIDGMSHDLAEWKNKVVILVFTCNSCGYAGRYEDRIAALADRFDNEKVAVIAINSSAGPNESLDKMREHWNEKGFTIPYLKDSTGLVGKQFGVSRTPEFVVMDGNRNVVYLGALDDDAKGESISQRYVDDAVAATLDGQQPETTETRPIGGTLKFPQIGPTQKIAQLATWPEDRSGRDLVSVSRLAD